MCGNHIAPINAKVVIILKLGTKIVNGAKEYTQEDIQSIIKELSKPFYRGITLTGGDPLADKNIEGSYQILKAVKEKLPEKDVWVWTGFKIEDLLKNNEFKKIAIYIDVLIDGKFDKAQRELDLKDSNHQELLKYRGSSNQRIINLQEYLMCLLK